MNTVADADLILSEVERLIGTLSSGQRSKALEAIEESQDGVLRLARNIASKPNVHSPAAVFMGALLRGEHVAVRQTGRHNSPAPISSTGDHRDWADRLYRCKIDQLRQHATHWSEMEQRQAAIDYALDHCRAAGTELWQIEREMRAKHGVVLNGSERDFERDTEHVALMVETHGRDAAKAAEEARRV